ncbi:MAG: PQQ-binding-like beta-propeller repeat protein [Phycisphaerales bacterium]|nr:PQQ-binding-like beta-propeller repeat protein [Phycisphaerales bacterium]
MNRLRIQPVFCILACLAILIGALSAADNPTSRPSPLKLAEARALLAKAIAPAAKLNDTNTKTVKKLITELGAPTWKVRENASKKLLEFGPEILPLLNESAGHKDIEVADRVGVAIKTIQAKVEDVGTELNPAIDLLAANGEVKLIGMLLELLNHASLSGRYTAEYALRRLTGQNFGYDSRSEPADRLKALAKWKEWWKKNKSAFTYDKAKIEARSMVLLVSNDRGKMVTAVSLQGKAAWAKKMRTTMYCATGIGNGNIIVGFSGSPNVEEYDLTGKSIWTPRNVPNASGGVFDIQRLPNGNTLVAYTHNGHVTEIDAKGKVVWQMTGLRSPTSAQRLKNGNTLIAEHAGSRGIEVDRKKKIVWQQTGLKSPIDALKLPNGNVLIGEYSGKRVLEVNQGGKILWQRMCPSAVSGVCMLPDGNIAITNSTEGAIVLSRDGQKVIRKLLAHNGSWGKIRLVPSAVLKRNPGKAAPQVLVPVPVIQPPIQIRRAAVVERL